MNLVFRLAWRNLWRHSKRTWLTTGAMIFSNVLLIFMIGLQFGMYDLMIDNTLQTLTGHVQIQAPGYKDDQKMRQSVADVAGLASSVATGSLRVARHLHSFRVKTAAMESLSLASSRITRATYRRSLDS
jgi:Trk-type K+ transport system membrane component